MNRNLVPNKSVKTIFPWRSYFCTPNFGLYMGEAQIWRYLTFLSANPHFEGTFGDTRNQAHMKSDSGPNLGGNMLFFPWRSKYGLSHKAVPERISDPNFVCEFNNVVLSRGVNAGGNERQGKLSDVPVVGG